jgi:hypothetical protein
VAAEPGPGAVVGADEELAPAHTRTIVRPGMERGSGDAMTPLVGLGMICCVCCLLTRGRNYSKGDRKQGAYSAAGTADTDSFSSQGGRVGPMTVPMPPMVEAEGDEEVGSPSPAPRRQSASASSLSTRPAPATQSVQSRSTIPDDDDVDEDESWL